MVGRANAIEACRKHPLARALRIDKLSLAALEATLRMYRDPKEAVREIPVLRMLVAGEAELQTRAEAMAAAIGGARVGRAPAKGGGGGAAPLELGGAVVGGDPRAPGRGEPA